ncbi:hypothetical protein [Halorhabdus amylolytica]|uniref:hypothetical protein n=1 Tax=Halorhabdus amylolytica TaxID=2559573 RepID=UPI0010AB17E6|nr:hypothetical protein [Halorhabdus amylolytica]
MSHALPALQVVIGTVVALLTYGVATTVNYLDELIVIGAIFVLGLFVAVHGLFRGIESAVAAATAPVEDESVTD